MCLRMDLHFLFSWTHTRTLLNTVVAEGVHWGPKCRYITLLNTM
uniref:Uncharacterized protein n=1 Tax=Anguilla anguilla TaxID=7936 RepID=A0A0E9X2X2_ANGAN